MSLICYTTNHIKIKLGDLEIDTRIEKFPHGEG